MKENRLFMSRDIQFHERVFLASNRRIEEDSIRWNLFRPDITIEPLNKDGPQ